jgi:hypothetical protein
MSGRNARDEALKSLRILFLGEISLGQIPLMRMLARLGRAVQGVNTIKESASNQLLGRLAKMKAEPRRKQKDSPPSSGEIQVTIAVKSRFLTLDAMRGIAAFVVLTIHLGGRPGSLFPGGYLAVDLFFVLSGFVLAQAYGNSSASFMALMRVRLIRGRLEK